MSLIRTFSSHEEMRRIITVISRDVKKTELELKNARRNITVASLRAYLQRCLKVTAAGGMFDEIMTRSPIKIEDSKKPKPKAQAPINKMAQILEKSKEQLDALNNMETLLNKHFSTDDTIIARMKSLVAKLKNQVQTTTDEANSQLSNKVEQSIPPILRVFTDKLLKWARTAGLDYDNMSQSYNVDTAVGVVFASFITLSDLKVGGTTLDYIIAITCIPSKKANSNKFFVSIFNEPVTMSQLGKFGYGKSFTRIDDAITVIRNEMGLVKSKTAEPTRKRQFDKLKPWIESEQIDKFAIYRDRGAAVIKFTLPEAKDKIAAKTQADEFLKQLFLKLKEWRANTSHALGTDIQIVANTDMDPKNLKVGRVLFTFKKSNPVKISAIRLNELLTRLGRRITPKLMGQAMEAFK